MDTAHGEYHRRPPRRVSTLVVARLAGLRPTRWLTHPPRHRTHAHPPHHLPHKRERNVHRHNRKPCQREPAARRRLGRDRRPGARRRAVVLVDRLGVEVEAGQDEREAQVEDERVEAPEDVEGEGDELGLAQAELRAEGEERGEPRHQAQGRGPKQDSPGRGGP